MLVVGPGSAIVPINDSLFVLIALMLFVAESNASKTVLSGDIAISPGELPALISAARARTSTDPSMITRPGEAIELETLCEARTRVVNRLGGFAMFGPPPQAIRLEAATMSTTDKRAVLFKTSGS
jgi:hypothetical protein